MFDIIYNMRFQETEIEKIFLLGIDRKPGCHCCFAYEQMDVNVSQCVHKLSYSILLMIALRKTHLYCSNIDLLGPSFQHHNLISL